MATELDDYWPYHVSCSGSDSIVNRADLLQCQARREATKGQCDVCTLHECLDFLKTNSHSS